MKRPLGVQLSGMLKDRGIDVVFGIPGVHNQELYRGIEEAGLTHILARHEQGAGFMADGYARATGRVGVCFVITGPGLTNIMTPLGQAFSDSVPMLVIASCLDEAAATRGQLHQMNDQRAAAEAVCDWSAEAVTAESAYALVDRALFEFETRRCRPKAIHVPISVLAAQAAPAGAAPDPEMAIASEKTSALHRVSEALNACERPLFVFGGGAAHVTGEAAALLEKTGGLAFSTYAGRGVLRPDHPQYLGSTLARPDSAGVFAQADLVVAFGTELGEVDLWRDRAGHTCPMIRVDLDPAVLAQPHAGGVHAVLADAKRVIGALVEAHTGAAANGWATLDVPALRSKWRAEVDAEYPGVLPVMEALKACLPKDTMIYSDMTQFAYAAKEVWDMEAPGHWHHPTGFGTLGYALPAAIGGQIGRPGQPTLAIAGDYGFQYTMQEFSVAVELGLPIPVFLWDNGKLGAIEDSMTRAQISPNAVVAHNPDFVALARAFGGYGCKPASLAQMQGDVQAALAADKPTLIHVTPDIAR
jgi:acetolactate synthase-1/2/3 large subunit/5-guanidino-2-oxopentanoate decarboxylase